MKILFAIISLLVSFATFAQQPKAGRSERQVNREQVKEVRKNIREFKKERRNIEGEIQLSGAFALYPLAVRWSEEFRKIYPKVKIDISAGGAGKGITDALTGMVDLGMVSREIHQSEFEKGAISITVAKDAVVATINARNPVIREVLYHGLKHQKAIQLWGKQSIKTWGELIGINSKVPIHAYTRSDACGAAETWAAWMGLHQENLEGTAVFGDPGVASVVQRDRVAIGFNNLAYAYDIKTRMPYRGIMVMPLDVNNNGRVDIHENFYATADQLIEAIQNNKYPAPPARNLYLVCKGKPEKEVVKLFLKFIVTQGQLYNVETLYIPISEVEVDEQLIKIN